MSFNWKSTLYIYHHSLYHLSFYSLVRIMLLNALLNPLLLDCLISFYPIWNNLLISHFFRVRSKEDGKMYAVKIANEKYKGYSDRDRKLEEVEKWVNETFFPQGQGSINLLLTPSPPPKKSKEKMKRREKGEERKRKREKRGKKGKKEKNILPCSRIPTRSVLNYPDPGGFKINLFKNKKH